MKYIQGEDRNQISIFPISLDDSIPFDNEVRVIDAFVDNLNLKDFGFDICQVENGRPAYHPADLLKLYIYGYLNKIRSSRALEKECTRNIEMIWLLKSLKPDHNTISNFRKNNPKAIKKVFRETVRIAKYFNLIGGVIIAGDSTKLRAQNSKKNNFNQKKIDRHLEYIENKLSEYERQMAQADGDKEKIKTEIKKHKERKQKYKNIETELKENSITQVSTSDPDSRQMITRNNITEVAYNVQTTVDSTNNIPIDYKVTNTNDSKAMGDMLRRAKTILGSTNFTALYDKGYHTGTEFQIASDLDIDVMVAIPSVAAQSPNPKYNVENFIYDKENDKYICSQNKELITTGKIHKAKTYNFKRYTTKACMTCPVKQECSKAKYGKAIQRSEYQDLIEKNKARIQQNQNYYRKRQAIVEHPYGTIKRQWGFDHIMTKKTINRANSDVGLIMIAYNIRRLINILGIDQIIKYIKSIFLIFSTILDQNKPYKAKINLYTKFFNNINLFIFTPVIKNKYWFV